MKGPGFEQRWRQRFSERGAYCDDDAGIAGWSTTGLASRVRQFEALWQQQIPADGLWLDIGCGAGTYTRMLHAQGTDVLGIDYSAPSLLKAKARSARSIPWLAADIHRLPLADASAAGILCFGVMQALSGPQRALAELRRVLQTGAEVWVDALNARCLPTVVQEHRRRRAGRPPHLRYDVPADFVRQAEASGLEVMDLFWLPLIPGRLAWLQGPVESRPVNGLLHMLPPLGQRLSHSFIVRARRV